MNSLLGAGDSRTRLRAARSAPATLITQPTAAGSQHINQRAWHSNAPASGLLLIGIFKLIKAAGLLAVALGALTLLHKNVAETVSSWASALKVDPANRYVANVLSRLQVIGDRQLEEISAGTFVYAGLFAVEGVGLLLRKRWAEYFTSIATGALIPLELYELAEHPSMAKLTVIAINVGIVWYLVARLRRT